jgi:hypothetical protein
MSLNDRERTGAFWRFGVTEGDPNSERAGAFWLFGVAVETGHRERENENERPKRAKISSE